jgi:site-specific DNA-methyltransferase (adenine-specific)
MDIKPSNRNTNKHTKEGTALLKKSINDFGVLESIATATDGTIITGHARFEQFKENGLKPKFIKLEKNEFAVLETDIENDTKQYYEAQIMANTTANKNFDLDIEMIEVISEEYDIDIEEVGVEVEEVDEVLEANEDDFDATPPTEPITVLGDLYEIGDHRLLCGDSTQTDTFEKLMQGELADMVITDPPYNVALGM